LKRFLRQLGVDLVRTLEVSPLVGYVTKVDPPAVKAWAADMKDAGTGVPTIENALGVLRMVLADAVSVNRLIRNPCEGVKAPKRQHQARGVRGHAAAASTGD
jgi:site-specific recombinase XerC